MIGPGDLMLTSGGAGGAGARPNQPSPKAGEDAVAADAATSDVVDAQVAAPPGADAEPDKGDTFIAVLDADDGAPAAPETPGAVLKPSLDPAHLANEVEEVVPAEELATPAAAEPAKTQPPESVQKDIAATVPHAAASAESVADEAKALPPVGERAAETEGDAPAPAARTATTPHVGAPLVTTETPSPAAETRVLQAESSEVAVLTRPAAETAAGAPPAELEATGPRRDAVSAQPGAANRDAPPTPTATQVDVSVDPSTSVDEADIQPQRRVEGAATFQGGPPISGLSAIMETSAPALVRDNAFTTLRLEAAAPSAPPTVSLDRSAAQASSVAQQIAVAFTKTDRDAIDIRLDPPDLGRVNVTLSLGDDGARALVTAERQDVIDLIRRHGELLERDLSAVGFGQVTLEFQASGGQADEGEESGGGGASKADGDGDGVLASGAPASSGRRLDIRL
ncbi:MAG: flagellar hook-length control protein FliK [Pseudomonadota bacterium]